MKNTFLYFITLTFILLLVSCNKNNNSNVFYFDQTGCSNPWDDHYTADTFSLEAYSQTINDFLTNENIEVSNINIGFDSTKIELCLACHCKTGRVIEATVSSGNKRKMKRLGFYN